MTHRYIKIGATALVLVLAFTGMLWSTLREGAEYYKNVDEVMVNPQAVQDKQLQLHGYVVPNSILVKKSTLEHLRSPEMPSEYLPPAPPTFTAPMTIKPLTLREKCDDLANELEQAVASWQRAPITVRAYSDFGRFLFHLQSLRDQLVEAGIYIPKPLWATKYMEREELGEVEALRMVEALRSIKWDDD